MREPAAEPWGLTEMQIEDPGGIPVVLVEVPAGHQLRRDPRSALPPGRSIMPRITVRSAQSNSQCRPVCGMTGCLALT